MSLSTLRPRTQLLLAVLVPLTCCVGGVATLWPAVTRLQSTSRELEQTKIVIQQKKQVISQAEAAAEGRSLALAVALPSEEEPIVFLRQLAALTAESGPTLLSVRAAQAPPLVVSSVPAQTAGPHSNPGQPQGPPSSAVGQGQRPVIPATVRELTDEVTVEGRFGDILALIVRLENFERILSVSRCRMRTGTGSAYGALQASFTLSRFVAAANLPPTQPVSQQPAGR